MLICYVSAQCPQRPKGALDPLGLKLQTVVRSHVGARNQTWERPVFLAPEPHVTPALCFFLLSLQLCTTKPGRNAENVRPLATEAWSTRLRSEVVDALVVSPHLLLSLSYEGSGREMPGGQAAGRQQQASETAAGEPRTQLAGCSLARSLCPSKAASLPGSSEAGRALLKSFLCVCVLIT